LFIQRSRLLGKNEFMHGGGTWMPKPDKKMLLPFRAGGHLQGNGGEGGHGTAAEILDASFRASVRHARNARAV
jgi:hypothetical protein